MSTWNFRIAGVTFRPIAAQVIANKMMPGVILHLIAEPTNEYDPFAIQIFTTVKHEETHSTEAVHLGYVPARHADASVKVVLRLEDAVAAPAAATSGPSR